MEEELHDTDRVRRRKEREAAGKEVHLPLLPPVQPNKAPEKTLVREKRVPKGAAVIREPLQFIALRREEKKRKREELSKQPPKKQRKPETGAQRLARKKRGREGNLCGQGNVEKAGGKVCSDT